MKPADIIILLIVIVAMVFAARKAAGHFKGDSLLRRRRWKFQETEEKIPGRPCSWNQDDPHRRHALPALRGFCNQCSQRDRRSRCRS